MPRTFTPSERASILSARKSGTSLLVLARRFHVRTDTIAAMCKESEAPAGNLTPPPYATGYRTAVYGVSHGAGGRRNLSWSSK